MKVNILISTPKGMAESTEKKLRPILLKLKRPDEVIINDDKSQILWVIEDNSRKIDKIIKAVYMFDFVMKQTLSSRPVQYLARMKLSKDDQKQFKEMLLNQTTVEVVKEATAQELAQDSKSVFAKLRDKINEKLGK